MKGAEVILPLAPVRWRDNNWRPRLCVDPAMQNTPTREDKHVRAMRINHREL